MIKYILQFIEENCLGYAIIGCIPCLMTNGTPLWFPLFMLQIGCLFLSLVAGTIRMHM